MNKIQHNIANKLPEITLLFWIMKIAATTLWETAWDLLSMTLNIWYALSSILLITIFFITLVVQLKAKKFHPLLYWTVILSTSTAWTTMSDFMDRTLWLGYAIWSSILISILIIVLSVWYYSEKSLSVINIKTPKWEIFYWTAILFSNTLWTAFWDFLADNSGLWFAWWAIFISSLILFILLAKYYTKISPIILFWIAFVLTRPLWATFGDFLTKTQEKWWIWFGTIWSSKVLLLILIWLIIHQYYNHNKKKALMTEEIISTPNEFTHIK